jgi:hypothetical protein
MFSHHDGEREGNIQVKKDMPNESITCEQSETKLNVTRVGRGQAFLVLSVQSPSDAAQSGWESYIGQLTLKGNGLVVVRERIFGPVRRTVSDGSTASCAPVLRYSSR